MRAKPLKQNKRRQACYTWAGKSVRATYENQQPRLEEKGEVLAAYVGLMGLHTGLRTGGAQCVPQGMWKMLEAAIDRVTKKVNGGKQPLLTALASGWTIVSLLQGTGLC